VKETKIGNYWYPLRAIGVAMLIGAGFAVATVVLLVELIGR
jgi:hypothetical protein